MQEEHFFITMQLFTKITAQDVDRAAEQTTDIPEYPHTQKERLWEEKAAPPLQTAPCSAWLTGKCRAYEEKTRPYSAIEGKTAHFIRRPVFSFC